MEYNEKIGNIIGQEEHIKNILSNFKSNSVFLIHGIEGSGKSFLAMELKNKIANDYKYQCFSLVKKKQVEIDPFEPFLSILNDPSTIVHNVKKAAVEVFEKNHLTGIILSMLKVLNSNKEKSIFNQFTDEEFNRVLFLSNYIKKKKVVFICDDVNNWSSEARLLLLKILRFKNRFSGFKNSKFIILTQPNDTFFNDDIEKNFFLQKLEKNKFKSIIAEFNHSKNDLDINIDEMYDISDGNIKIIVELMEIIKTEKINRENIIKIIIEHFEINRLNSEELLVFLRKVAFLGEKTLLNLLEKFVGITKNSKNKSLLNESFNMKILEKRDDYILFINHIIYNSLIEPQVTDDRKEDYLKLSKCIYELFPNNYILRSEYLSYAGEFELASTLYVVHSIEQYRMKRFMTENFTSVFGKLGIKKNHITAYKSIVQLYDLYYKGSLTEDILISTRIKLEPILIHNKELCFELDYIYSLFLINYSYQSKDFHRAIKTLSKWHNDDFKKTHFEMWIRNSILLMDLYYELDKNDKEEIMQIVKKSLFESTSEEYAKNMIYTLYLKSNLYCDVRIAYKETLNAFEYFKKDINLFKTPQNYCVASINHSANCLILGKYEESYRVINEFIKKAEHIYFKEFYPEAIGNNLVLSSYFNALCSIDEAIDSLKKLGQFNSADQILIKNNMVVFYALKNEFEIALELSSTLYSEISLDDDDYYAYYIINNYALLNYMIGNKELALSTFAKIINLKPLVHGKEYFESRNNHILKMMSEINYQDLLKQENWNDYLINTCPRTIGDAWNFWGKLCLLSELQIWSDC